MFCPKENKFKYEDKPLFADAKKTLQIMSKPNILNKKWKKLISIKLFVFK